MCILCKSGWNVSLKNIIYISYLNHKNQMNRYFCSYFSTQTITINTACIVRSLYRYYMFRDKYYLWKGNKKNVKIFLLIAIIICSNSLVLSHSMQTLQLYFRREKVLTLSKYQLFIVCLNYWMYYGKIVQYFVFTYSPIKFEMNQFLSNNIFDAYVHT